MLMLRTLISELRALKPVVWAAALGAVIVGAFLFYHRDWRLNKAVYERGLHAVGTVTAKDIVGHKKVEYRFRAGDKTYYGESTAGYGNPSFAALSPDDQVIVFYLPEDPSVSIMGDPKLRVEDQHRWIGWSLLFFTIIFVVALGIEMESHA